MSNPGPNYYQDPGTPQPPDILATNFYNNNVFSISFNNYQSITLLGYKPSGFTLNFTNDTGGLLTLNGPINTNYAIIDNIYNLEYFFDYYRPDKDTDSLMANFVNRGTIRCDSILDGNNLYYEGDIEIYELLGAGRCVIWATNIVDPGDIEVSVNGAIEAHRADRGPEPERFQH